MNADASHTLDSSLVLTGVDGGRFCEAGTAYLFVRATVVDSSTHTDPDDLDGLAMVKITIACPGGEVVVL